MRTIFLPNWQYTVNWAEINPGAIRTPQENARLQAARTTPHLLSHRAVGYAVTAPPKRNIFAASDAAPDPHAVHHHGAAGGNDRRAALSHLKKAVELGWDDSSMAQDPDLQSLRQEPDFKALVDRVLGNKASPAADGAAPAQNR